MKEKFVSRVCEAMAPNVLLGISVSVNKKNYEARREENRANGMEMRSPYDYCFIALSDWLMEQAEIRAVGVSFILEHGHGNNAEVEKSFQDLRQQHKQGGVLRSLSFHTKQDSRAIQLADLYAYYSRRQVKWIEEHPHQTPERDPILAILPKAVLRVVKDVFSD